MNSKGNNFTLDYKPKLPKNKNIGIGIVGAGEIIQSNHLPAYSKAGLNIVAIYDIDYEKAKRVAKQFNIKKVYSTLDDLLNDSTIEVVDIAIPATYQLEIVRRAAKAKKHLLCQKPLAKSMEEAYEIAKIINEHGVKAAVNQQMRYSPSIQASHHLIEQGLLGTLTQAEIQVNVFTDWESWEWITKEEKLEVMYHSIHYLDSIRYLYGTPEYIYANGSKYPGQKSIGETRTTIMMQFSGNTRGLVNDNHNNAFGEEDWYATFRFEGTDGVIKGTNGALYNYPVGREDTLSFKSNKNDADMWYTPKLHGKWFPDAFMGTMGELLLAIEENRTPQNSVDDNLLTLKMMFVAYLSMKENRPVWLNEL